MDYDKITSKLVSDLSNFLGYKKAIIGISGGIDSAVVAYLCEEAVDKSNIFAVTMPYGDQSTEDADLVARELNLTYYKNINIKPIVDEAMKSITVPYTGNNKLVNGNMRARVRMLILYAFAGAMNGMVIGTSNKTELSLGYFTKFGDGGCDVEPIGDLYKTEIFELAKCLGIPFKLIDKAPSAELWEGQTDEGEIGMTYKEMDGILAGMDTHGIFYDRKSLIERYGENKVIVIEKRYNNSDHKRKMPKTFLARGI